MNTYQAFQLGGGYEGPFPFATQSMPPGAGGVTSVDDLRTVFVTGFPSDVRDRELHNLLRFLPGYEACQMSSKSGSAQGFALFANSTFARQAMEYITNMEFDHEMRLRCELAHKNMYLKDDPSIRRASGKTPFNTGHASVAAHGAQGPVYTPAATTALQVATGYGPAAGAGNSYNHIGLSNLSLRPVGTGNLHPYAAAATMAAAMTAAATQSALASTLASAAAATGVPAVGGTKYDNPPCNTLFIGNLGDSVDEAELLDVFNRQPGFRQLKLVRNPRQVSGFVEFADVPSASLAHANLQAATLTSSNRGPIRIQYSKNPFGRRSGDTSQQQGYSQMHPGMAGINASPDLNWPPSYTSLG